MKVGDMVKYYDGLNDDDRPGVITKIEQWVDRGAPDRNFGVNVWVLWSDGSHQPYEPDELIEYE